MCYNNETIGAAANILKRRNIILNNNNFKRFLSEYLTVLCVTPNNHTKTIVILTVPETLQTCHDIRFYDEIMPSTRDVVNCNIFCFFFFVEIIYKCSFHLS